jgi:hypothetical protein
LVELGFHYSEQSLSAWEVGTLKVSLFSENKEGKYLIDALSEIFETHRFTFLSAAGFIENDDETNDFLALVYEFSRATPKLKKTLTHLVRYLVATEMQEIIRTITESEEWKNPTSE